MYNIIKNPETNRNVSIYSKKGIAILEKYLNNLTVGGGLTDFFKPKPNKSSLVNKQKKLKLDMPDEFRSDDYQSKLQTIINIIQSYKTEDDLLENIKSFKNENKKYLNKNMLYFVTRPCFRSFVKPDIEKFKTKYDSENKDFFTKIYVHKDEYDFDTNIYEFHLTNIISVVFILYTFVSQICSWYTRNALPREGHNDEINEFKSLEYTKKILKEIITKIKKLETINNKSQKFELLKDIHRNLTYRFMLIVANQVYQNLLYHINHALENAANEYFESDISL